MKKRIGAFGEKSLTPIPTIDGENTLTIDTPVQPSSVRIGGFTDLTEAQLAYLRYKYDVKK